MSSICLNVAYRNGAVFIVRTSNGTSNTFVALADLERINRMSRKLHMILSRCCRRAGGTIYDYSDLQALGSNVAELIFPLALLEELTAATGHTLEIQTDSAMSPVPFEVLFVANEALCLSHPLTRWRESSTKSQDLIGKNVRFTVVANPQFNLSATLREADTIRRVAESSRLLARVSIKANRITVRELQESMANSDILHYAGHAETVLGNTFWNLIDGSFGCREITELECTSWPHLIFANACSSSNAAGEESQRIPPDATMAEAFLSAGVLCFIGTLAPIIDSDGKILAECFYRHFLTGTPVAEALRQARLGFISRTSRSNLLWACYLLLGNPQIALPTRTTLPEHSPEPGNLEETSFCQVPCSTCKKTIRTRHGVGRRSSQGVICRRCNRTSVKLHKTSVPESDAQAIARVVAVVRGKIPMETSLSAASVELETGVSHRLVKLAFRQLCDDNHFIIDEFSDIGMVISQSFTQ